jgi:hypothetical protein
VLEILILIGLGKNIASKANAKGRSGTAFVFMLLGLWFGGEIFGAILGVILAMGMDPHAAEPNFFIIWVCALVGAAIGAVIAFAIVNSLADLSRYDDDFDDREDFDRRPRRRDHDDRDDDYDRRVRR